MWLKLTNVDGQTTAINMDTIISMIETSGDVGPGTRLTAIAAREGTWMVIKVREKMDKILALMGSG